MRRSRPSSNARRPGRSDRGGLAAAAAFLERSTALTLDPARRAERTLGAALAQQQAGASDSGPDASGRG